MMLRFGFNGCGERLCCRAQEENSLVRAGPVVEKTSSSDARISLTPMGAVMTP